MNIALIVFAGSGTRIHSDIPKQFIKINDQELVVYTINKFIKNPNIDEIVLVTSKEYIPYVQSLIDKYQLSKISKIVEGGASRQESVRLGLLATGYNFDDKILIHDGDRPLVSNSIINQCLSYLDEYKACCPVIEESENYQEVSASGRKIVIEGKTLDIQTPQSFTYGIIKDNHLQKAGESYSDDIGLVEDVVEVKYFQGEKDNFKVTKDRDLDFLRKLIENKNEKDY